MENGENGRAPSLDDVMRAVLPEDMPMHPDHPMQQAVELEVVATAQVEREAFERKFVVPAGVYWSDAHQEYRPMNGSMVEVRDASDTTMLWFGWSARALLSAKADDWAPSGADYDKAIHGNPDAKAWADLFVETFPGLADKRDLMIGWFANAMMAMHDHLARKNEQQPKQVLEGWRIERSGERIVAQQVPAGAGYAAARAGDSGIAESVLYLLAETLLAALSPQPELDDEIPDFTTGNGNKARRRAEALGLTGAGLLHSLSGGRHGTPGTDIDVSEGGHCD